MCTHTHTGAIMVCHHLNPLHTPQSRSPPAPARPKCAASRRQRAHPHDDLAQRPTDLEIVVRKLSLDRVVVDVPPLRAHAGGAGCQRRARTHPTTSLVSRAPHGTRGSRQEASPRADVGGAAQEAHLSVRPRARAPAPATLARCRSAPESGGRCGRPPPARKSRQLRRTGTGAPSQTTRPARRASPRPSPTCR